MVLEAVYKVARCLGHLSVHQHLRLAESCSTHASDNGLEKPKCGLQAGAGWGSPYRYFRRALD